MAETMRAMGVTAQGCAVTEIPIPTPGQNEVRVRVIASAVNPGEEKVISGNIVGRFLHAKTSPLVLGWDIAGTVDAVGDRVGDLRAGDAVWGHLAYSSSQTQGAFAEFVTIPREAIATKPEQVPYDIAAAAATVAMTGLQSLRDLGRLAAGGAALIIGAGGGIGSVAVGIGQRLGGRVTGVCSTKDVERVRSLGAETVIDRRTTDPFAASSRYDVVFDTPGVSSFSRCAKSLRTGGTYVTTMPSAALIAGMVRTLLSSKRCRFVQVASRRADLELVGRWLAAGLTVPIDSRHRVADLETALERQMDHDRVGRVVVQVAGGWPA